MGVPAARIRLLRDEPPRPDGEFVLYWMIAARRARSSFALDRAIHWARELRRPLVVLEALRLDYPHASDRLHAVVLAGMADNAAAFAASPVAYLPYVERAHHEARGLLAALAARACVVVTDDYPTYFLPHMLTAAALHLAVRLEAVDGNGLTPMRAAPRVFPTARGFRSYVHRGLPAWLADRPVAEPLRRLELPRLRAPVLEGTRWLAATVDELTRPTALLRSLPLDHAVVPVPRASGPGAALGRLRSFVRERLARYELDRNHPDLRGTSGLSPDLHFGHLSSHDVLAAVLAAEGAGVDGLRLRAAGQRVGFWGVSSPAEAFLEQLVTWRELGFNACAADPAPWRWETLPAWARATLEKHRADRRPLRLGRAALEAAESPDPLWNAAQRQLLTEGVIQNYLRMLWGKLVLAWTEEPAEALELLLGLNDRWALDGRDPNSYSGILWCFGRYDRAWGPQRPIYGTVRYMTSASTQRKLRVKAYLEAYGAKATLGQLGLGLR